MEDDGLRSPHSAHNRQVEDGSSWGSKGVDLGNLALSGMRPRLPFHELRCMKRDHGKMGKAEGGRRMRILWLVSGLVGLLLIFIKTGVDDTYVR